MHWPLSRQCARVGRPRLRGPDASRGPSGRGDLRRGRGYATGPDVLSSTAYFLSKFGLPYTTRAAKGPALLVGGVADILSVTFATNALGGRVAVMATSLVRNRTSGLYNLRKQELYRRLFDRLSPDGVPVASDGTPGLWLLAQVSEDGCELASAADARFDASRIFADSAICVLISAENLL